jgi:polysaccharide pyruvyl transferase WcaK-like protein
MIIHHYHPMNENIGDFFVRDGIRKLLREQRPDARFIDMPVNRVRNSQCDYGLRGSNLDRSLREADLIVVGGSNLYESRKGGEWGVTTDLESIAKITKPVLLIGLGAGSRFKKRVHKSNDDTLAQIVGLNGIAIGSSVRDVLTADFLKDIGLDNYTMTGCPAVFLFERPLSFKERPEFVAISFPPVRFSEHRIMYWMIMRTIRKYVHYCGRLGLRAVLSCHDSRDIESARSISGAEVVHSCEPKDYYDLYSEAAMVIGFRLHAAIMGFSLGTPFVPISFDMRTTAFGATFENSDLIIDGTRPGLYGRLVHATEAILNRNSTMFDKSFEMRDRYSHVMRSFLSVSFKGL